VAITSQVNNARTYASDVGNDVFFYVSGTVGVTGSNAKVSVFGGDVVVSGTLTFSGSSTTTGVSNGFGAFASMPAAGNAGSVYVATDAGIPMWVDDGTEWCPLISGNAIGKRPPLSSSLSTFNMSTGSITNINGGLQFEFPSVGAINKLQGVYFPLSSSTAYIETCVVCADDTSTANYLDFAIGMRESSTAKSFTFVIYVEGAVHKGAWARWTNDNTLAADAAIATQPWAYSSYQSWFNNYSFYRVRRDATTLYVESSHNRRTWYRWYSIAISTVFTSEPDQVILGAKARSNRSLYDVYSLRSGSL